MEDSSVWLFMLAVGIAASALLWATVASVTAMASPVRRRLKALKDGEQAGNAAYVQQSREVNRLWKLFEPNRESEKAGFQLKIQRAGFRATGAVGLVYGIKLLLALLVPTAALIALAASDKPVSVLAYLAIALGGAFLGSLLPDMYLSRRYENRKVRLMEGLPDALDLLVTCTEAGLGLNAALERVVEQLPASHPDLAVELGQVNAEIRAGIDRNTALKNLGERTGLEEISGLVSLISHSSRLGTGIASTLRIYAEDFRDRRMQRAEEIAATVGTKLIFPLLLCMFPAFFVVSVGPAMINVMKALSE